MKTALVRNLGGHSHSFVDNFVDELSFEPWRAPLGKNSQRN